jgi:hypothetical protein
MDPGGLSTMMDWIHAHDRIMWGLAGTSAFTFVASLFIVPLMIVRIPVNYFDPAAEHPHPFADHHPVLRTVLLAGKNLLGLFFVLLGVLMLILPGQGVLTILAGMVLIDFPGRRRAIGWVVSRKAVLNSMNWIRERAGREALVLNPREFGGTAR